MAKTKTRPDNNDPAWVLAEHLVKFTNVSLGRKLRPSRALYDAVTEALDAGYTQDDLRVAFWSAVGLPNHWIRRALREDLSPEVLLRFKGGTNPKSGVPAKRWLDELVARADETNPVLIGQTLSRLPQQMRDCEREFLTKVGMSFDEE